LRVLLDENLAHSLRNHLGEHDAYTAAYAGFAGLKNGKLLDAAEEGGFDVLITGDKTLHHEQNMPGRRIALVCLSAISWPVIQPYLAMIVAAVDAASPGSFTKVECGAFNRRRPKAEGPSPG
jgi:hypothetical protein